MSDVVWSVNILLGVGLIAVALVLLYILRLDAIEEKNNSGNSDSSIMAEDQMLLDEHDQNFS